MLRVIRLYLAKKFHRDYKRGLRFTLEILRSYCEFSTHLQRFCFFFPLCLVLTSPQVALPSSGWSVRSSVIFKTSPVGHNVQQG